MIAVPGPQPAARWGGRTLLHRGGWPTKPRAKSNRGEVVWMGSKRCAQLLRVAVCVVVVLAIALYFAPKAC